MHVSDWTQNTVPLETLFCLSRFVHKRHVSDWTQNTVPLETLFRLSRFVHKRCAAIAELLCLYYEYSLYLNAQWLGSEESCTPSQVLRYRIAPIRPIVVVIFITEQTLRKTFVVTAAAPSTYEVGWVIHVAEEASKDLVLIDVSTLQLAHSKKQAVLRVLLLWVTLSASKVL